MNNQHPKILVSACLLGQPVRYDGRDNLQQHNKLLQWQEQDRLISFCPEVAGGLPVPRPRSNIHSDDSGFAVLKAKGKIISKQGEEFTKEYLDGAYKALKLAKDNNIKVAILKENSPSCGSHFVYDATGTSKIPGMGTTAALLTQNGIKVFSENEIDEAINYAVISS